MMLEFFAEIVENNPRSNHDFQINQKKKKKQRDLFGFINPQPLIQLIIIPAIEWRILEEI